MLPHWKGLIMGLTYAEEVSTFKAFFAQEILPILEHSKASAREIEIARITTNMAWLKRGVIQDRMDRALLEKSQ